MKELVRLDLVRLGRVLALSAVAIALGFATTIALALILRGWP